MDDQQLDTLIQEAISVEPSPEFLARVRADLEERRIERTWSPVWVALAAMAALSVAGAVGGLLRQDQTDTGLAAALAQASATTEPTIGPPPAAMRTNRAMPDAARSAEPTGSRRMPVVKDDFPKVMISAADAAMFQKFMAGVHDGSFELTPDVLRDFELVQNRGLVITPLSIDPISPIEPLSGQ
jgi:hypothetical protein